MEKHSFQERDNEKAPGLVSQHHTSRTSSKRVTDPARGKWLFTFKVSFFGGRGTTVD
jgi:hypothetical protein